MVSISWQASDGERLKFLRHAAGFDIQKFAKINSISVAQLKLLEDGGDSSLFYSPAIKASVGRKLLSHLGEKEAPGVPEQAPPAAAGVASAQTDPIDPRVARDEAIKIEALQTLDKVAADSVRNLEAHSIRKPVPLVRSRGYRQWYLLALLVAVALLLVTADFNESVQWMAPTPQPLARKTSAKPAVSRIETTQTPAATGPAGAVDVQEQKADCRWGDQQVELHPVSVRTAGNYVHFVASAEATVCVVDGAKKSSVLSLKAGDAKSVRGEPPWQVYSRKLPELKVFYQGYQVPIPAANITHIGLRAR